MQHRERYTSCCAGHLRSSRKNDQNTVGIELTMRAVFPLTPNEDLKAGQYWFARRTADAEVAPAQAEDLAPAQIASVTQSDCVFLLSVSADPFCGAMPFSIFDLNYPRRYRCDALSAHALNYVVPCSTRASGQRAWRIWDVRSTADVGIHQSMHAARQRFRVALISRTWSPLLPETRRV